MNAGDASHLVVGLALPRIALRATTGEDVCLADIPGLGVLIVYPWTGRPDHPNPPNWDDIPGAHGSTPELEGFRDRAGWFAALGLRLFGLSRQATDYQRELVARLALPFPILSDAEGRFCAALDLPTFNTGGEVYLKRLTLLIGEGRLEAVFYPVPNPADHAAQVLLRLKAKR